MATKRNCSVEASGVRRRLAVLLLAVAVPAIAAAAPPVTVRVDDGQVELVNEELDVAVTLGAGYAASFVVTPGGDLEIAAAAGNPGPLAVRRRGRTDSVAAGTVQRWGWWSISLAIRSPAPKASEPDAEDDPDAGEDVAVSDFEPPAAPPVVERVADTSDAPAEDTPADDETDADADVPGAPGESTSAVASDAPPGGEGAIADAEGEGTSPDAEGTIADADADADAAADANADANADADADAEGKPPAEGEGTSPAAEGKIADTDAEGKSPAEGEGKSPDAEGRIADTDAEGKSPAEGGETPPGAGAAPPAVKPGEETPGQTRRGGGDLFDPDILPGLACGECGIDDGAGGCIDVNSLCPSEGCLVDRICSGGQCVGGRRPASGENPNCP